MTERWWCGAVWFSREGGRQLCSALLTWMDGWMVSPLGLPSLSRSRSVAMICKKSRPSRERDWPPNSLNQ